MTAAPHRTRARKSSTLRAQADAALAHWADAGDPVRAGRAALRAAAGLYREHGTIMRALNVHSMLALPADATDADLDQLVDTLATVWERATLPAATGRPAGPPSGA